MDLAFLNSQWKDRLVVSTLPSPVIREKKIVICTLILLSSSQDHTQADIIHIPNTLTDAVILYSNIENEEFWFDDTNLEDFHVSLHHNDMEGHRPLKILYFTTE